MILLFFFWKYCRATSDSVDSGEKTPRLTNLVCAWQMCCFLQYLCNFIMCFLVEVIIATFKSLIPRMEQKAVKLPVCRLSACCCLAPGNQNRDVFAENSSPWHIYISQNSQTDILPLFLAIPSTWKLQGRLLSTPSPWLQGCCAYAGAFSEAELCFAFQAMYTYICSVYRNCLRGSDFHVPLSYHRSPPTRNWYLTLCVRMYGR